MSFKIGDKVVCINKDVFKTLEVGKIYTIGSIFTSTSRYKEVEYQLVGDEYYYPSELFRDIKEYRKQQIKKINESSLYKWM